MQIRMQVIRQPLDRRIEQLCRQHHAAGEHNHRPPQCRGSQHPQRDQHGHQRHRLGAHAVLAAHTVPDARQRIA